MATPGVFPDRVQVGIPEFATDFEFTHDQVGYLFDCNPDSPSNSSIAMKVEDTRITVVQKFGRINQRLHPGLVNSRMSRRTPC